VRAGLPAAETLPETRRRAAPDEAADGEEALAKTTSGNLDILTGLVEETMQAAGYSPRSMQAANHHDLLLMMRRLALSPQDSRRILGLFRRILWRLRRTSPRS